MNHFRQTSATPEQFTDAAVNGCPDCYARTTIRVIASKILAVEVEHDPSCPWYAQQYGNRAQRRSKGRKC
ncbi:hypothetical protein ABIC28_003005 [Rhodococcus sp. PvR044]|uniref:hypothetical protein n=1 Tax=Rhodococcus sp. PvR044 TaxID=3156402 RepID=UPI003394AA93